MEIAFGGGAVADPAGGDAGVTLDRRGHGPAHRLDVLGAQVAGDGKEAEVAVGVHHRQLATLERIPGVGQQLADHLVQRRLAGDEDALLAIGGEMHVVRAQGQGLADGDGFLAQALHIEGQLLLPLGLEHPRIEQPGLEHGPEALQQQFGRFFGGPGADGATLFVEDADQLGRQLAGIHRCHVDGRLFRTAGGAELQVAEVGGTSRSAAGFGNVQAQGWMVAHGRPSWWKRVQVGRRTGWPSGCDAGCHMVEASAFLLLVA